MKKLRKAIRVSVNRRAQDIFLTFYDKGWIITTHEGDEGSFSWDCFDRADAWLASMPGDDESRLFRDIPGLSHREIPNALMIWQIDHRIFFGYDTGCNFWGGPMSRETFRDIWEEIRNGRKSQFP